MAEFDQFQPIDGRRVGETIQNNFAATYLTILGIVQNVVFAILIFRIFEVIQHGKPDEFFWTSVAITFFIIILVWDSYQWYPYLNRWAPRLPDSMIPFFLGASQSILALSVDNSHTFYLGILLLGVVAVGAYSYTLYRIKPTDFQPQTIHKYYSDHLKWSIGASGTQILFAAIILACCEGKPQWYWLFVVLAGVFALFLISGFNWRRILNEYKIPLR